MEKPRHTGGRQHQWPGQFPSEHCPTHVYRTYVMQIIGDQRITIECSGVGGPGQFIVGSTIDVMVERGREPLSRLPWKLRNIIAAADATHSYRPPLTARVLVIVF